MAEGGEEISNETTKTWWFLGCREHRWPLEAEQGHDTGLPPVHSRFIKSSWRQIGLAEVRFGGGKLGEEEGLLARRGTRGTDSSHPQFSFRSVIILIASAHHHPADVPRLSYPLGVIAGICPSSFPTPVC